VRGRAIRLYCCNTPRSRASTCAYHS